MKIKVAGEVGFCFGVKRAIAKVDELLNKEKEKIYVTGELIHNREFLRTYEGRNIEFNENVSEYGRGIAVIRAHGISDEEREKLMSNPNVIRVIDASCPYVLRVHHLTKKMVKEGYHVVIVGEPDHPETRGYYLNVAQNATVISSEKEIHKVPRVKKIAVFAQTTMDYRKFKRTVGELVTMFDEVRVFMSICPPVYKRQVSAEEISKSCDLVIVLGGVNSSNTRRLRDICAENTETVHLENINQIDLNLLKGKRTVGLVAGTSTPDWVVKEAIIFLENYPLQEIGR